MSSRVITIRLDTDSLPYQIFESWEKKGYEPRKIIENVLMLAEGIDPPQVYQMNDNVIEELRKLVDRLDGVAKVLQCDSAALTNAQQQVIDDVLNPAFLDGMRKIVRPGFSARPDGND